MYTPAWLMGGFKAALKRFLALSPRPLPQSLREQPLSLGPPTVVAFSGAEVICQHIYFGRSHGRPPRGRHWEWRVEGISMTATKPLVWQDETRSCQ